MSTPHPKTTSDVAASLVLVAATILALICANTALAELYKSALATPIHVGIGAFAIDDSLKSWIKNALMAVFFLSVGLEIKSEFSEGALANRQQALLPFLAAAGGMLVPALVYSAIVQGHPLFARGWAIPSATDIAFAVGVVGFLGHHVSSPMKAFLLAVAVIDDLGAILIIALFYSGGIAPGPLAISFVLVGLLKALNMGRIRAIWPYLLVGVALWIAVYHSGVNPTLAGVIVAMFIPLRGVGAESNAATIGPSPLHKLVSVLKFPVAFVIMPIFAFANAGVSLKGMGLAELAKPVTMGVMLGLLIGKPIGITLATMLAEGLKVAARPPNTSLRQLIGLGALAGIGFTMSLFTGNLAFGDGSVMDQVRLGVLAGSVLSTLLGVILLIGATPKQPTVIS
jgi:Na+:H+ antiporter, NhaA family